MHWLNREYSNEDNSPRSLNDKNYQASSPKFREVIVLLIVLFDLKGTITLG